MSETPDLSTLPTADLSKVLHEATERVAKTLARGEELMRTARLTIQQLEQDRSDLRNALGFAASVIKSGESWTETCEKDIGAVLRRIA